MVLPCVFSVTCASLHQILALHLMGVAGRGHAAGLQGVDLQWVIKTGRGNVAKKWLRFHALVKLLSDYQ